jgi:endonuclease YncB( thermonuclease family)
MGPSLTAASDPLASVRITIPFLTSDCKDSNCSMSTALQTLGYDDLPVFTLDGFAGPCKVVSAYDGDTCYLAIANPLAGAAAAGNPYLKIKVRLAKINAYEVTGAEAEAGAAAKRALVAWACGLDADDAGVVALGRSRLAQYAFLKERGQLVHVRLGPFDKYGRPLAVLTRSAEEGWEGSVNAGLVRAGHAVMYMEDGVAGSSLE